LAKSGHFSEISEKSPSRNITWASRRAILVALAYPEPTRGKRSVETTEVNSAVLSQARAIVKWCPEHVEKISKSRAAL
jgi:hypothetical protein